MMKSACIVFAGLILTGVIGVPSARTQMGTSGAGRSLGGYGAATINQYYSSGMGMYLPYNGTSGGFVPYRGGYAAGLGTQPIPRRPPQTPIGGTSMPMTPIGGASLSGGMGAATRGGMTGESGRRTFAPFGYGGGIGLGTDLVGTPMTTQGGMRRSPSGPGLGYPFQMPLDLPGTSAGMPAMAP